MRTLLACLYAVSLAFAQKAAPTSYLRLDKTPAGVSTLQTEARRFVAKDGKGPTIWLVGAAHIASPEYYASLQTLLDAQGLVLYEAVTRNGKDPTQVAKKDDETIYGMIATTLGLSQQLKGINYHRSTFRRSDVSWEELQAQAAKGGPESKKALGELGKALDPTSAQGKMMGSVLDSIKKDPGSVEGLRLAIAEGLGAAGDVSKMLSIGQADLLISMRNAHVESDLKAVLAQPSPPSSIALFYGAAHMPNFENKLERLGFVPVESRWFSAISADSKKLDDSGRMLLGAFRSVFSKMAGAKP